MSHRSRQFVLVVSTVALSWFAMMAVHEFGHVLHAWWSGGTIERVALPIAGFSQTFLDRNPHPRFVAAGGAVWGCLVPLLAWAAIRWRKLRGWYVVQFLAGFCLIANGGYLAAGAFLGAGDAGDLHRHGVPNWLMVAFGAPAIVVGLWLWHGLGTHFGLGDGRGRVDGAVTTAVAASLIVFLVLLSML